VAGFDSNRIANETPELKNSYRGKPGNQSHFLSQAVAAKLEDGNLKAAIWLLVSDETYSMPHHPPRAWL